jgi:hypothetical protein
MPPQVVNGGRARSVPLECRYAHPHLGAHFELIQKSVNVRALTYVTHLHPHNASTHQEGWATGDPMQEERR